MCEIEFLKSMPIISHKIEIDIGNRKKLIILEDFNCRFSDEPILFTIWLWGWGDVT